MFRYQFGVLVARQDDNADHFAAYFVGYAGDYLVAVLDIGVAPREGDLTYVSGLGRVAIQRAGGVLGEQLPASPPASPPASSAVS